MSTRYLLCPFCGFEFEKVDTLCRHGCPMNVVCNLVRCPSCDYEFPDKRDKHSWMQRLLKKGAPGEAGLTEDVLPIKRLKQGEQANVVCLAGASTSLQNTLAVFGLIPGSDVTLVQRYPSCVVRIGETELALDSEIAQKIMVARLENA